jgi:two-component system, oxyanion-binding sensor
VKRLRVGYVPLSDAAVLIAAAECGFAEREHLDIELVREASWANIRDKLILGLFDAAHMLAPFAIATSLGLGHVKVPLAAPFALNLNGNAITVSRELFMEMSAQFGRAPEGPVETAKALASVIGRRRAEAREQLTFAMVFPFSTHTYLLRHWLRLGGIDPERDINLVVVPPPYMAESLRKGLVHGFCVGSPWNSLAVESEIGRIAVLGVEIAHSAPEKILAVTQARAIGDPDTVMSLIRALRSAARWCEEAGNRGELARLLAAPGHLGLSEAILRDALEGNLRVDAGGARRRDADFLPLGRETTNRPDPRQAKWLFAEMVHAGQTPYTEDALAAAASVYRPDLYDRATGELPAPPKADPVMLTAGPSFTDPDTRAYLAALGA